LDSRYFFPSQREGIEGWAIENRRLPCQDTENLNAMGILLEREIAKHRFPLTDLGPRPHLIFLLLRLSDDDGAFFLRLYEAAALFQAADEMRETFAVAIVQV